MPTKTRRTVLLIDDSAEDRAMYCRYLQRGSVHDYQILEAGSAAVGLDLYQHVLPDLILLDYSLPGMDGLEFLACMQQEGRRVPVLMLTGQGNETIAAQAIKRGAQDYLIKGHLTADGLCKALDYAIEQWQLQQRLQQQQQQQILNAIALRIRQSLTLHTILDTSVAAVQQFLKADRVVIYQFASDMSGQIVAEAVLPQWLVSLNVQIEDTCFRELLGDYRLGRTQAIDNIYDAGLTDCHIQLLERFQVKANLVVPLLITDQNSASALPQLWGLLVVHQCSATRQWQPFETDLLNQVAVQIAIAIQHAELYRQLQHELAERRRTEATLQQLNQELETRVQERTAKLQASEASLREAQRIAHLGNWELDLATQDIIWSEELFRLFGLDVNQGEPDYAEHLQSFAPESRHKLERAVQQVVILGSPYDLELQFSRADGSVGWVFVRGEAVRNHHGEVVKLLGTALDITDRKQTEAQLRHLSDRLTLAVKSGAIAIWDWNVTENILTWDDRMYELYGITPNQFTSVYDAWASSLHLDDRPYAEAAIQQALAGEKDYDPEFRVVHPNGTIRFIKAYALVERDEQGELKQMIGINYDITDRKQSEQALQQLALDLQRSNQELEQFAYVASHDLQEPLRAITSYTQLFAKRYQGQIDAKADKYIDYVVDGAARMQQLIQDLLAYSRVGRYELKQQPTDCTVVLEQVRKDLQVAIAESQAEIIVDPLPTIFADTAQVAQVFENLIGNALKYRGQAPLVVSVSARQQVAEWVFSIQDNGIGIEPQYAERIFEIFQRLHTRREYDGTGLGLAICKKIIERHHGRIWVESQLRNGATFWFTLPVLPNDRY
ncbi:PAS domain-containing protein [Stenomitos frigidus]|nr:PAS domain-containing protein [Stenomitos frigidus]